MGTRLTRRAALTGTGRELEFLPPALPISPGNALRVVSHPRMRTPADFLPLTAPLWFPVVLAGLLVVFAIIVLVIAVPIALVHDFGRANGWWR